MNDENKVIETEEVVEDLQTNTQTMENKVSNKKIFDTKTIIATCILVVLIIVAVIVTINK